MGFKNDLIFHVFGIQLDNDVFCGFSDFKSAVQLQPVYRQCFSIFKHRFITLEYQVLYTHAVRQNT